MDDAGIQLPDSLLVDLGILVPQGLTGVQVSSMYVSAALISVSIACDQGGLLTATFLRTNIIPYRAYPLNPVVPNASGWVVFGSVPENYTRYHHFSTAAQALLEMRAVRVVSPPGVSSFQRSDGDGTQIATNIVALRGNDAVTIKRDPYDSQNILIGLSPGYQARFAAPCTIAAESSSCGVPPVRSINNVKPDENGIITILFK